MGLGERGCKEVLKLLISVPALTLLAVCINTPKHTPPQLRKQMVLVGSIITMYISLYLLLTTNNNNMEFQFRDVYEGGGVMMGLGVDGISTSLILVTTILMPILILLVTGGNSGDVTLKMLLLMESMLLLLFSALDLFLFFTLFELLLIPMFFLIRIWGEFEQTICGLQVSNILFNGFLNNAIWGYSFTLH